MPCNLGAVRERQVRLVLVEPAALRHVAEQDGRCPHLDQDVGVADAGSGTSAGAAASGRVSSVAPAPQPHGWATQVLHFLQSPAHREGTVVLV
jgi:hypothetical protein